MHFKFKAKYLIILEGICLAILVGIFIKDRFSTEQAIQVATTANGDKKYIKWVEFNVTYSALDKAYKYDVETHGKEIELHWIELLAYLGAKYGGDFKRYKEKDMVKAAECILSGEETIGSLTEGMKYYPYYYEAYEAVLGGWVGEYEIQKLAPTKAPTPTPSPMPEGLQTPAGDVTQTPGCTQVPESAQTPSDGTKGTKTDAAKDSTQNGTNTVQIPNTAQTPNATLTPPPDGALVTKPEEDAKPAEPEKIWEKRYGLKAFSPIARNYYYYDYDDFGVSRSYGYKRQHLGHDMMGSVGSPIIAVESGYIEALGWNMYGGWRIGIRSFDGKRYYYYAHLRKNFPYNKSLEVGSVVTAGQVIGYLGRTGYSRTENTNNIQTSHLHFGLQLIFDESQKEGNNEIWVDCYAITKFLYRNRSECVKNEETKEYSRILDMKDPAVDLYQKLQTKQEPLDENSQDGVLIEYE